MDLGLAGRVAIVTGASRGIGLAVAQQLADEGAQVIGVARTAVEEHLEGVTNIAADIRDLSTPALVVREAMKRHGRLDVLVNNAGTGLIRTGYSQPSDSDWHSSWELLFMAVVRMTNAALPNLLAGFRG